MKLNLLKNGLNSLEFGLEYYLKYLRVSNQYDERNSGLIKLAVICIQNSVEILFKKILSDSNELLIYKNLSDFELLESLSQKLNSSYKRSLDDILMTSDSDIRTIEYSECIERAKVIFKIEDKDSLVLKKMGYIRNKVTHFGIERAIDFHDVIGIVNRTLDFITEFFYPRLQKGSEEYHPMDYLYESLLDAIEIGQEVEEEIWGAFFYSEFEYLNKIIRTLEDDNDFREFLEKHSIEYELEIGKHIDERIFQINLSTKDDIVEIYSHNLPELNLTILSNQSNEILAIIDQAQNASTNQKKLIYVLTKKESINNLEFIYGSKWKNGDNSKTKVIDILNIVEIIKSNF